MSGRSQRTGLRLCRKPIGGKAASARMSVIGKSLGDSFLKDVFRVVIWLFSIRIFEA